MANEFKYTIRADDRSKQATQSAQGNMGKMESSAKKLGDVLKTAFSVTAIIAVGKKIGDVVKDLSAAYAKQETAERKLAAAAANNPLLDDGNVRNIQRFASELQSVSTVGDEVTLSFAGMLASMGRSESQIKTIMSAATDLSAATGISLDSAVRNLNKTFGGLSGELGELIPEMKDLTKEQLEAGEGVELVAEQFDGLAQSMQDTTEYSQQQFANAWGDLKEALGKRFAEDAQPVRDYFTNLITDMTNTITRVDDLKTAFAGLAGVMNQSALQQTYGFAGMTEEKLGSVIADAQATINEGLLALFDEAGAAENFARAGQGGLGNRIKGALGVFGDVATGNFANTQLVQALNDALGPQATREDLENLSTNQLIDVIQSLPDDISDSINVEDLKSAAGLLERALRTQSETGRIAVERTSLSPLQSGEAGGSGGDGEEEFQEFFNALDFSETRLKNMAFTAEAWMDNIDATADAFLGIEEQTEEVASGLTTLDLQFGKTSGHVETMGKLMSGELMLAFNHAEGAIRGWQAAVEDATPSPGGGRGSEEFTEGLTGGTGSGESGEEGTTGLGALAGAFAGPIGMLIGYLLELLEKIEAVKALMAPVLIIIDGFLDAVAPAINEGLAPLVGIFYTLGEILGQLLLPILEIFVPVIELLGKAFVWLYNSVFVPVHNQFKTWGNKMYNFFAGVINALIDIMNRAISQINKLLPKKRELSYLSRVGTRDLDSGHIDPITYEELAGAGEDYVDGGAGGAGGSSASYTTGRDITVNIDIYSEVIAGEGGIRDLAVMIRDEIREAEALGV